MEVVYSHLLFILQKMLTLLSASSKSDQRAAPTIPATQCCHRCVPGCEEDVASRKNAKLAPVSGGKESLLNFLWLNKAEHQLLRVKQPGIRCSLSALQRDLSSRRSPLASLPGLHPARRESCHRPGPHHQQQSPRTGSALGVRAPSSAG